MANVFDIKTCLTYNNGTTDTTTFEHYGYRSMWQIAQTCVLTIFACTWTTIHPNIPSRRSSSSKLDKVHFWIVAMVMPDLLLLWAAKQYMAARNLKLKNGWKMTQAFFALMGGIQDEEGNILSPYSHDDRDSHDTIQMQKNEEIKDKSKRDYILKYSALLQTSSFIGMTIYRIQSPVLFATEAEIVAFTFGFISVFTNILWYRKPQDVKLPFPPPDPTSPTPPADLKDTSPNFIRLAASLLRYDDSELPMNKHIPNSAIYTYSGALSWDDLAISVLCTSILGSACGVCHAVVASLQGGLSTTRGLIWFSLALIGSAFPFYLLFVIVFSFILKVTGIAKQEGSLLYDALNGILGKVSLFLSGIARVSLIVVLIYFMFSPYNYTAFRTPLWSQYVLHIF